MPRRLILAAAAALAFAGPASAAAPTLLVKFSRSANAGLAVAAAGDVDAAQTATHATVVQLRPGDVVAERLAAYRARPDVVYAELNGSVHAYDLAAPTDPDYAAQWGLAMANAVAGWSLHPGAYGATGGVLIAVVDTGVDATHEDLTGRVRTDLGASCSTVCVADPAADGHWHGTHVAGVAAASTDNGLGIAGLAFSSEVIPVQALFPDGAGGATGSDAGVANGIVWAAQHGAKVINLSLGGVYSQTICDAVATATNTYGALIVAAAGNESTSAIRSPAGCPGAVGVAATDEADTYASFSNYGSPDVFVSAPGVDIYSTIPGNAYDWASGTSMASPFVAGVAALRRSEHPTETPDEVRRVLAASSAKVGGVIYGTDPYGTCTGCTWQQNYGYGRVDVAAALSASVPPAPVPPPPPPPPPPPSPPAPIVQAPPADTAAPSVHAYAAKGRRGRAVKLVYRVRDDHGNTAESISVYRGSKLLKRIARPLRQTDDSVAYWVAWRAPRGRVNGRFCVRAADAAGNAATSCAPLRVR